MVAAMSHSYRYPDPGDRVTAGAIRAVGVEEAELRRQESEVLDIFENGSGSSPAAACSIMARVKDGFPAALPPCLQMWLLMSRTKTGGPSTPG